MRKPMLASDIEGLAHEADFSDVNSLLWWQEILTAAGTKDRPTVVDDIGQYHNDGWVLEWAFKPATCPEEYIENELRVRQHIERTFGLTMMGVDWFERPLQMVEQHAHQFPWLNGRGNALGCAPDCINGRYRKLTGKARIVRSRPLREAGLHMHLDLPPEYCHPKDPEPALPMVQAYADATSAFHTWDHPYDKPWYRMPGTYRPKNYGVEYRSLGASIINDMGKLKLLADISFDFLRTVNQ